MNPNPSEDTQTRSSESGWRSWLWVPSLYFAEGIPYVVVMLVSVIMYKRLGVSNTDIALYTSWLYLPWVIKPLWSPVVDILRTKRFWIVTMQLVIGAGLGGVALTIPAPDFFKFTLGFLWLLAFSSATHDIAADGFYMLGLSKHDQAWFVGIRSTFYRLAMITGQGLLIILAGYIESTTGLPPQTTQVLATTSTVSGPSDPGRVDVPAVPGSEARLESFPPVLQIPVTAIDNRTADSLVSAVRDWNRTHGFYEITGAPQASPAEAEQPSLWTRVVSRPLGGFLKKYFAPEAPVRVSSTTSGNVGIMEMRLTAPPPSDQPVVVNFGREAGDKSIGLVEGARFVITSQNWQTPVRLAFQLDPKLDTASRAEFVARSGNIPLAWSVTFAVLTVLFLVFFLYHLYVLPRPAADSPRQAGQGLADIGTAFVATFASFFRKPHILVTLAFFLLYRFAEAQLVKLASPFLLDAREVGGLALTTGEVGFVYGTVGVLCLTFGGLLGGFLAAKDGLKHWLWWMAAAINLPNAVYVFLAYAAPDSFTVINICVGVEQFGYGFGFTAFMLYMIYAAEGEHKTAHFAMFTGFMALGMMLPGMFSGWLQEIIGYQRFFVWVVLATIPAFVVTWLIPLDPEFGKKSE